MNILPKKKWHVRTKDNIARVRRDEQQAADEEKERQRRTALAEQESRTDLLRKQAKARTDGLDGDDLANLFESQSDVPDVVTTEKPKHVNIFEDVEEGRGTSTVNAEHEQEKKAEQEKYEKGIGYLTYLGQSAQEAQHAKPWYTLDHDQRSALRTSSGMVLQNPGKDNDAKLKAYHDPLQSMKSYISKTAKPHSSTPQLAITGPQHHPLQKRPHSPPRNSREDPEKRPAKTTAESPVKSGKSIEELRLERLRREDKERQRTKQLLAEKSGIPLPTPRRPQPEQAERRQKYNSQFNPERRGDGPSRNDASWGKLMFGQYGSSQSESDGSTPNSPQKKSTGRTDDSWPRTTANEYNFPEYDDDDEIERTLSITHMRYVDDSLTDMHQRWLKSADRRTELNEDDRGALYSPEKDVIIVKWTEYFNGCIFTP